MRVADALTEWRAHRWLTRLSVRLVDGLAVAASVPGLTAAIDQHAAAVRDVLQAAGHPGVLSERALLAAYARGLLDRCDTTVDDVRRHATGHWSRADWLALRLLAVATMARSAAPGPRPGGARPGWSVPTG